MLASTQLIRPQTVPGSSESRDCLRSTMLETTDAPYHKQDNTICGKCPLMSKNDRLDHRHSTIMHQKGSANSLEGRFCPAFCRPHIDDQHLVVLMVYLCGDFCLQAKQLLGAELAAEDGQLEMIAPVPYELENPAKPPGISYVIADYVCASHRVSNDGRAVISPVRNLPRSLAWISSTLR